MGWTALVHHASYEEAHRIADPFELGCVSCRQYEKELGIRDIQPIVTRIKIAKYWYNYFENGKYYRTKICHADGSIPESYAPYYYMPDKIRYLDLMIYLRQHMMPFQGLYTPFLLYRTADREEVIYSVFSAQIHMPLRLAFDNPLLFYTTGRPKAPPKKGSGRPKY